MSEYCSYGEFCKVDLQLNNDESQHRHHINCPKCKKMLEPIYKKGTILNDCSCFCAENVHYSCACGNTFTKNFECTGGAYDEDDEYEVEYSSRPKFEQYSN